MEQQPCTDLTCRVCLNVEELMVNIYEEVQDFQSNLVDLLQSCGGLMVDRSDNLPKYLCKVCVSELLVAAKFREKCSKSNELFSQMIQKEKSVKEEIIEVGPRIVDDSSYVSLSEELLNEIIIEEAEDNQEAEVPWNDTHHNHSATENLILVDQNPTVDSTEEVLVKDSLKTEMDPEDDDFIVFDEIDEEYVVETIPKDKVKTSTKKRMQKAAPFKYDCDECGAAFSNHENLKRHLRIHPEFLNNWHTCQLCLHSFTKEISLQTHSKTCQLETDVQSTCEQRNANAKKKRTRNEVCNTCGKVCNSEASLRVHIRTHTNDRPYPCTECPKAFKTQAALSLHLKRHAGQFDWECEVCGKQFVESSNLRVHMRTHTGEKPHLCKVCGRKFSRVFLLQLHLRTHTGEKPYKCDTCLKAFSQKSDLEIHTRTHTGVRPYVCPICSKGFVKSYVLQKHFRQHPKEATDS